MRLALALLATSALMAAPALAGNTSSNSSSNSSNGVHTRVDTLVTDDDRGRRTYERRVYRERAGEECRRVRRGRPLDDDDDD